MSEKLPNHAWEVRATGKAQCRNCGIIMLDNDRRDTLRYGKCTATPPASQESAIPPGMYQDTEGKVPARIGDPVGLYVQADPFARKESAGEAVRAKLEAQLDEVLFEKMRELLTQTANMLKGSPAPLMLHSWHDLPEVAATLTAEVARLTGELDAASARLHEVATLCATVEQECDAMARELTLHRSGYAYRRQTESLEQCRKECERLRERFALAYGLLWHVNAGMDAPHGTPSLTPERGAMESRKLLRDMLTREQRGDGINAARNFMAALSASGRERT